MMGYKRENGKAVPMKDFNAAIWIFSMRARFPKTYNQPRAISVSQRLENDLKELKKLTPKQLAEQAEEAARYLKEYGDGKASESSEVIDVEGKDI